MGNQPDLDRQFVAIADLLNEVAWFEQVGLNRLSKTDPGYFFAWRFRTIQIDARARQSAFAQQAIFGLAVVLLKFLSVRPDRRYGVRDRYTMPFYRCQAVLVIVLVANFAHSQPLLSRFLNWRWFALNHH